MYSYDDRNSDHRLMRADACADVGLYRKVHHYTVVHLQLVQQSWYLSVLRCCHGVELKRQDK